MYPPAEHTPDNYEPTNHSQPGNTQTEYAPEDFSQAAINRGQRQINYALTMVEQKIIQTIEALKHAIAASPAGHTIDLEAVEDAINEAKQLNEEVASIKPPGCERIRN